MNLSQFFRQSDLSFYPQVGLVLFLAVFVAVTLRAWSRRQAPANAAAAHLPLDDAPLATPRTHP